MSCKYQYLRAFLIFVYQSHRLFFVFLIMFVISGCGIGKKGQHRETSFDDGIRQINHLVVVYMENHSFDNLYGEFKGVNGIKNYHHPVQVKGAVLPVTALIRHLRMD